MTSDWILPVLNRLAEGGLQTLALAATSVFSALFLGLLFGTALAVPQSPINNILRTVLRIYMEIFRGMPLLVTLFIVFFISPSIGIELNPFVAAVVGLTLWGSANVMEVAYGALASIPKGQREAASSMGFGWRESMQYILLPQAFRRMLPPIVNLLVDLIQATTLASLIGFGEVLQFAKQSIERLTLSTGDGHAVAILLGVLIMFFILCYPLTLVARYLEKGSSKTAKKTIPAKPLSQKAPLTVT